MINLNPTSLTEYYVGLPLPWLAQGPNGQANGRALGFIMDTEIYNLMQAVQARFPHFAPPDAYGQLSIDRQLIQGYNDGYNVSPALDGYLFPDRLVHSWEQWKYAGTALGMLLQLHYQGVDGYIVQQNGLAFSLDTTIASFRKAPEQQVTLTCTTAGFLGTAVFSYVNGANTGTITTQAQAPFTYQLPNTQTLLYFAQMTYVLGAVYVIDTTGFVSYWNGATPGITHLTSPQNALRTLILNPNPNLAPIDGYAPSCGKPPFPISIKITTTGALGTMRFEYSYQGNPYSAAIISSSSQFSYLIPGTQTRILFYAANYTAGVYTINTDGTTTSGSGTVSGVVFQYSTPWMEFDANDSLWSRFLFVVNPIPSWWTNIQPTPTLTSAPNLTTINILRNIIQTWKAARSTCLGICVPIAGNQWDFPPDVKWDSGLTWDTPTPNIITYGMTDAGNYQAPT